MPRMTEPLTDARCRQTKGIEGKIIKLFDGGGLFLDVRKSSKKWRLRFRHDGKESLITIGDYPQVSLSQARKERDEIKQDLKKGVHPVINRSVKIAEQIQNQAHTLRAVAEEWIEFKKGEWSEAHTRQIRSFYENHINDYIGDLPIKNITSIEILSVVRRIEKRGFLTLSRRVLGVITQTFWYGVSVGLLKTNVAVGMCNVLKPKKKVVHHPYVEEDRIPELIYKVRNSTRNNLAKLACELQMHVLLRPFEIMNSQWSEIDVESKLWTVPVRRMKGRLVHKNSGEVHLIPLTRQVIELLFRIKKATKRVNSIYLFPSSKRSGDAPMNKSTIKCVLNDLGYQYEQTSHGFRGLASTIINEHTNFDPRVIDAQLAHKPKEISSSELSYNHAKYMKKREKVMQWWSDYLEKRAKEYKPIFAPEF